MFEDYFAEVRNYLNGVPTRDQDEMIQFYEEQAMDAGWTVDQMVQKYGTPKQLARSLRLEYAMDVDDGNVTTDTEQKPSKGKNRSEMILLILLLLLASPVLFILALILIPIIGSVLFGFVMMVFGIYATVIGLLAGGLLAVFAGFTLLSSSVPTGLFFMGMGLVATGLAVIFGPIIWNITKWLFEKFIDFMKWIGRKLVSHRRDSKVKEG
ncbi:putative membrane protein [Weissella uvarum]|uniref:DUF1700 domain-containing protein n=1 Tax=Weissella uvarum TaxID=1479233 RepID=UPI001961FC64|nr:DUF1700 domain-containing protein [Weissella uvarum]MBM7617154.1 putative membrane protein [Weissella uvarum]MCM0595450.1 DUF1700 domain-containing protein [Weissella uvarum]